LAFRSLKDIQQLVFDRRFQCLEVVNLLSRHTASHFFKNVERGRYTDIRRNQHFFELVQQLFVDLFAPRKNSIESFGQRITRSGNSTPESRRELLFESSLLRLKLFHREIQTEYRTLKRRSRRSNRCLFDRLQWRFFFYWLCYGLWRRLDGRRRCFRCSFGGFV